MKDLLRSYGRVLTALFVLAVIGWGAVLIVLPQLTMIERAMTPPKRQLDSSVAATLRFDASTCQSVLKTYEVEEEAPASNGGLAIPSMGGMAIPSMNSGGMAVPSMGGAAGAKRPYILQCDRANTHARLVRGEGEEKAYLDELYDLPLLSVDDARPIAEQLDQAAKIGALADDLYKRLLAEEANRSNLTLSNFGALTSPKLIPLTPERKAVEQAQLGNRLYGLIGLRFEKDGEVYERLGLTNLTRTLVFAMMVTALALAICYPIAYKVALATPANRVVWLMLGLIIPYAIVELMRIYAWTAIIDNRGLLNSALLWLGAISEPIQFNRMPGTIFVVIAYTYVLFMVFPMLNVMTTLDKNQIDAARDLGASPFRVHRRVIIPHAKPGIAVGCIATFMLAAGAFSVPRIISRGLQAEWFSQTIYNKFFESENSNVGAAYSFAYTLVCFVIVALFMWLMRTRLKDFARVR
ncbi:ABC transporter permease [Thalassovita mangrovi]|uniref:ABC transporter permease subunit n=1 Tax=Thalassovita mangrovi TaxID=2692236 RepID=A0A6L8LJF2_9RHOB|nr:ABC transporter permease [Thalassovita mangrovi]MYM56207.1 ABC transporter permease subunit [Thalassovita mangrovi]